MVERQLPKLHTRVRFPSPAPESLVDEDLRQSSHGPPFQLVADAFRIDPVAFASVHAMHEPNRIRFYPAAIRVLVASRYDNKLKLKIASFAERIGTTVACNNGPRQKMHFMIEYSTA
jgi:hypothetical protein